MKRTTPRRRLPTRDEAITLSPARTLRRVIDVWFDGSLSRAAKAFGLSNNVMWLYSSGREPVSRPILAKMKQLNSDKRRDRHRLAMEALERHEREADRLMLSYQIEALPEPCLRSKIPLRRLSNRRKKRAA